MYRTIKRQNGEACAPPVPAPGDPFALLAQAGYDAFYADTLARQNSISRYFAKGELLCTFNDAARYQKYHIVHAVKKNVESIRREDFRGREARQDEYGTSVISIQMLKSGGFISIKNRYNHAVTACDHTFNSNPDNIIEGLSAALKDRFKVEFTASNSPLPAGFVLMGGRIFKYHREINNIYYGDQAWAEDGTIHTVDRAAGDALFDFFLFDAKTRTLKNIDPELRDSFAADFNRYYGGDRALSVRGGNLMQGDICLIGAGQSQIKTLYLPGLTRMGDKCLWNARTLTAFTAPALTRMGNYCLYDARDLTAFHAPALTAMGDFCLRDARALTAFTAPALIKIGAECLWNAPARTTLLGAAATAKPSPA